MIYKYRSTGNASDRGRGCFHPLPRGGDIPSTHCRGTDNLSTVNVNTHTEILFPSPATAIRSNRHALPAPISQGRPGGGGVSTNTERRRRQGRRIFHPRGMAILHRYIAKSVSSVTLTAPPLSLEGVLPVFFVKFF